MSLPSNCVAEMFMREPSNACANLDHIGDILNMVSQEIDASDELTDALKRGMVLIGNAFWGHVTSIRS
jgi:hypothetical protein